MKIGILTFHCAHNYGAVLQTYGLQEQLKELGHEVDIIDYRPEYIVKPYAIINISRFNARNLFTIIKSIFLELLKLNRKIKRSNKFKSFIKGRLNLTPNIYYNLTSIPQEYDAYVFGSDQIWSPKITEGFDEVYFGAFKTKNLAKRISYAASIGDNILKEPEKKFIRNKLQDFDAISVREIELKSELQKLTTDSVYDVLDPTLLLSIEKWEKIIKKPDCSEKYVLVYQLGSNDIPVKIADKIAKRIGAKVLEIKSNVLSWKTSKEKMQCESPEEFLGWIKHAEYVVTTSFHGTAFSIIFNKSFYSIGKSSGGNQRISSLLSSLNLHERLVINSEEFAEDLVQAPINWEETNNLLANLVEQSKHFLVKNV